MEAVRNSAWYLTAVKAKLGVTSDYALAKALRISRQVASKYARGENIPGPVVAFRVAEILGEQPAAVVAVFEAERAERAGAEQEADEWKGWVRRIGGAAASILLAAGLGGIPNADARLARSASIDPHIHRIKRRGWWGGPLGLAL